MRMVPRGLMTKVRERVSREGNGAEAGNGRAGSVAGAGRQALGTVFKFRVAAGRLGGGLGAVARMGARGRDRRRDSRLFRQLPPQLQEQARAHDHVWEYLNGLPIEELGVPEYYPRLSPTLRDLDYRNLIYPVGKGVFIHIAPDLKDTRDFYNAIEPSLASTLPEKMERIDAQMINYVEQLKSASTAEERTEIFLSCLDEIVTLEGRRKQPNAVVVTEEELDGLRYLMLRDKEGLGDIEPLIMDPYIEDISCSGRETPRAPSTWRISGASQRSRRPSTSRRSGGRIGAWLSPPTSRRPGKRRSTTSGRAAGVGSESTSTGPWAACPKTRSPSTVSWKRRQQKTCGWWELPTTASRPSNAWTRRAGAMGAI